MRQTDTNKPTGGSGSNSSEPTRAGETREVARRDGSQTTMPSDRWTWVEGSVWTPRMLAALDKGVKGGRWYSLMDKVCDGRNLMSAWAKVRANKGSAGVDHQTVASFGRNLTENLERLQQQLRDGTYHPQDVRRCWLDKPGTKDKRPLGIPTVRDRVVQTALRQAIEPIFEIGFAPHSYGFRPGRGCKDALRRVVQLLDEGHTWVVDADLKSYFDTIPKAQLIEQVRQKIADNGVVELTQQFLDQHVMDGMERWQPETGTPQGAVISPLLANLYLDPLDHLMAQAQHQMIRYADDFVIMCRSEHEAQQALAQVQQWTLGAGLTLHPQKTKLTDATQQGGFDFLGYHFERGKKWPRKKSMDKHKDTIRAKTPRTSGHSLKRIISSVNETMRGWFEYFKHSHAKTTFPTVDGYVRGRLRSILRHRCHRRGRGRGEDHQRWPNKFFADLGLFSTVTAHAKACQSY